MNAEERLLDIINQQDNRTYALIEAIKIIEEYYDSKEQKESA